MAKDNKKYDWDLWLAPGTVKHLRQGKDYTCSTVAMATQARSAASRRKVPIKVVEVFGGLIIYANTRETLR